MMDRWAQRIQVQQETLYFICPWKRLKKLSDRNMLFFFLFSSWKEVEWSRDRKVQHQADERPVWAEGCPAGNRDRRLVFGQETGRPLFVGLCHLTTLKYFFWLVLSLIHPLCFIKSRCKPAFGFTAWKHQFCILHDDIVLKSVWVKFNEVNTWSSWYFVIWYY